MAGFPTRFVDDFFTFSLWINQSCAKVPFYKMQSIAFNDKLNKRRVRLLIEPSNILRREYFNISFSEAAGIMFYDQELNDYVRYAVKTSHT